MSRLGALMGSERVHAKPLHSLGGFLHVPPDFVEYWSGFIL
jgi:hypothetical protein